MTDHEEVSDIIPADWQRYPALRTALRMLVEGAVRVVKEQREQPRR
ncbi:MAG TPA: hypothetical protein VGK74_13670 [Symbiobacteriaceae bacterium]|jgi:hypothetical protein